MFRPTAAGCLLYFALFTACSGDSDKDAPAETQSSQTDAESSADTEDESAVDTEATGDTDATGDTGCTPSLWHADADGDGFGDGESPTVEACEAPEGYVSGALDCDDADATVHPDAIETYYDGVDQDCDGANDYVQDGDGDLAEAYGGDDCDDEDATAYGSAVERLDATDNDCDGVTDEDIAISTEADWQITHSIPDAFGLRIDASGDLDGNGYLDILVRSNSDQFLFYGPITADTPSSAAKRVSDPARYAGDQNGDGAVDLLLREYAHPDASVHLLLGPFAGNVNASSATATIDDVDETTFGWSMTGTDLDQDGYGDVLASSVDGSGTVYIFYGPLSGSFDTTDADATVSGDRSGDYLGYRMATTPDVDGDGSDDVVIGAQGAAYDKGAVVVLTDSFSGDSAMSDAHQWVTGSLSDEHLGDLVIPGGDADGDGYGDLVACALNCEQVFIVSGDALGGQSDSNEALAVIGMDPVLGGSSDNAAALDFDGDDVLDLAMGEPSRIVDGAEYDGTLWIALGPLSGAVDMENELSIRGSEESLGYSLDAADLDGDGLDDLLVGATLNDDAATDGGAVHFLGGREL